MEGGRIAKWQNVIIEYAAKACVEAVKVYEERFAEWIQKDENVGLLIVLPRDAIHERPSDEFRRRLASLWRRYEERILAHALVYRGEGFEAAAFRGLLAEINRKSERRFPQRVFADLPEAQSWLADELEGISLPKLQDASGRVLT